MNSITFPLTMTVNRRELRKLGLYGAPGCYCVFDASGNCLYVGMSGKCVARRFLAHWTYASHEDNLNRNRLWFCGGTDRTKENIATDCAPPDATAKIFLSESPEQLERDLIYELQPKHNARFLKRRDVQGPPLIRFLSNPANISTLLCG